MAIAKRGLNKERSRLIPQGEFPWRSKFITKHEVNDYFSNPAGIQCLLCGKVYHSLGWHLRKIHGIHQEEYRSRYGLPWRRGLVSSKVSERLSSLLTERIRSGSFKPRPDQKTAMEKIRSGGRRKDQPFVTGFKAEQAKGHSKKNIRYGPEDFEKVLSAMVAGKETLREVCVADKSLPRTSTVLRYAEFNPAFRKKLVETYHSFPYPVQARADMFSPQFYKDLKRLKKKGLSAMAIGEKLGISYKTVYRRLQRIGY